MSRRAKFVNKEVSPDPKYGSPVVARFINKIMYKGKKSTAQGIVYDAFDRINKQMKTEPLSIFEQAMKNATPALQVKSRRVGGATYQVPIEVSPERGEFLATKWIITYARDRGGRSMAEKLAAELMDAAQGQGNSIKKKQDTHKMAEANKAFAHYRW
ncbi:MAG: 30S ribosomal protein S7 [Dehalococcoidia bacterium]|nr:30S ribosomal protein S7 [Dehalococcoidia bacterium]MDD5647333.1 30S ribosomal protein S7 [Dehalococcoidia bacterium]